MSLDDSIWILVTPCCDDDVFSDTYAMLGLGSASFEAPSVPLCSGQPRGLASCF